jgi:hypothetical protein
MEEDFGLEKPEEETPKPAEKPEPAEGEPEEEPSPLNDDEPEVEEDDEPEDLIAKYSTEPEVPPEQVKIKEIEAYLSQEFESLQKTNQQIASLNTLKDDKGVGIIEMTDEQFNEYSQGLQDTGKLDQLAKAQYNRNRAVEMYSDYTQRTEQYKQHYEDYTGFKEQVEDAPKWTQVGAEFEASYPGFKDQFGGKVREYLTPFLDKKSPNFNKEIYQASRTDDGRRKLVVQSLQRLGLLDSVKALTSGEQPEVEKKPSAPDVTTRRKRVQVNTPERDSTANKAKAVASMSQDAFNKLPDSEITAALIASLNGDSE